jgi:hypothetical protein
MGNETPSQHSSPRSQLRPQPTTNFPDRPLARNSRYGFQRGPLSCAGLFPYNCGLERINLPPLGQSTAEWPGWLPYPLFRQGSLPVRPAPSAALEWSLPVFSLTGPDTISALTSALGVSTN